MPTLSNNSSDDDFQPNYERDDMPEDFSFESVDSEIIRRERSKAQELRKSQWWKNLRGNGKCHYCGRRFSPKELTMDHIVPLARGGTSSKSNIVACCKECNSKKKYLLPIEWEEYLNGINNK
mgnify:CR=1 FL=1